MYGTPKYMYKDWVAWLCKSDGRSPDSLLISTNKMLSDPSVVPDKCQMLSSWLSTGYNHHQLSPFLE